MEKSIKNILVVDDEVKIVEVLKSYLESNGYFVWEAFEGKKALEMFEKVKTDLIILDLMLPDISGEEICKIIRKKSTVPIIMLTAKVEEVDILKGLDIGADDYVVKPFSPRQLVARVGALFRRVYGDNRTNTTHISINNGDLLINTVSYEVKKAGELMNVTPSEFKLLLGMLKYPSKVFTREELIKVIDCEDMDIYDRTIDTHIKNLRQKIETDSKNPTYILTVHGLGYRFGVNNT